jgi:hypothetical protein
VSDKGLGNGIDNAFRVAIIAEVPCTLTWKQCETVLDTVATLQSRVTDLESEVKALRLIANSHSMSELRRMKIMHPIADQALANDDEQDDIAMARGGRIDE